MIRYLLQNIESELGLDTKDHQKGDQDAIDKTHRSDKPEWYSLEHLMDYYRGMVILDDQRQIVDIARMIEAKGMGVVEFDYMKTIKPESFGYRDMNFTLRMPNGLMVEFQALVKEIAEVKPELHKLYEKWREYSQEQIIEMGKWEEYQADLSTSYNGYSKAWSSSLTRSGITQEELSKSLMNDLTTLGLVSRKNSSNSSRTNTLPPTTQDPSESLKNGSVGRFMDARLPSRSSSSETSDSFITTSVDNITQETANPTKSQAKSTKYERYKQLEQADIAEAEAQMEAVRVQYEGTDQWMKAPNGKPTKLNERQWLQVRTPAFKAWFGDWENDPKNASKVVDENGEPMVVYRGVKNRELSNVLRSRSSEGDIYFTSDIKGTYRYTTMNPEAYEHLKGKMKIAYNILSKLADKYYTEKHKHIYSGGNSAFREQKEMYSLMSSRSGYALDKWENSSTWGYLGYKSHAGFLSRYVSSLENQMEEFLMGDSIPAEETKLIGDVKEIISDLNSRSGIDDNPQVYECYLSIANPLQVKDKWRITGHNDILPVIKEAKSEGNDGVIVKETDDLGAKDVFIAFSPTQIKSATANVGTFDPENADIRYKLVPDEVNQKFNEEIQSYNQSTHFYKELSLGTPGAILHGADMPGQEIVIYGRTLKKIKEGHGIKPNELRDLPQAINDPIFVMRSVSPDQLDAITILTELPTTKGNMLVVLRISKNIANIEINKITSIYGKNKSGVLNWILNYSDKFSYVNKKRILDFLGNIYEGSNRPGQPKIIKDIDKINESVGLSSKKFEEVRRELQIGEFEPDTNIRYKLQQNMEEGEAGDPSSFIIMKGYKPTNTIKGYKAFIRDDDGNLKPLFVDANKPVPIGEWLEAKDTYHFTGTNGLQYVPALTGDSREIPNDQVRQELISKGFLPANSKAKSVRGVAYRPGWHGSKIPLAKQLGKIASILGFENYNYEKVYQANIVFAEVEFDMSKDYQSEINKRTGLQSMPKGGGYIFTTNKANEMQGNPWYISGAMKVGKVLSQDEVNSIVTQEGYAPKKWETDPRYKLVDEAVNQKFNEDLEQFDPAKHRNKRFNMGKAGIILSVCGIDDKDILMFGRTIQDKSSSVKHPFDPQDLKDLPVKINDPIFVMDSVSPIPNDAMGSKTILTEIKTIKGNLLAVIRTTQKGRDVEVNQIISIYPKHDSGVANWIINHQGQFQYINKEKALAYLSDIYEGSNSPRWLKLTKDIDSINESVGLSSKKFEEVRRKLQIGEYSPDTRYKLLDDDYIISRLEAARKMIDSYNADAEKIAEEVAETKGLDPAQVKEKLGRHIRSAYRETSEQWQTLLAASRIAGVDEFVASNKPENTDRSDLTFHISEAEQIAMYEEHIGLSLEEAMKAFGWGIYVTERRGKEWRRIIPGNLAGTPRS